MIVVIVLFFLWIGFHDCHRPYFRDVCPQENEPSKVVVPPYLVDGEDTRRDLADYYDENYTDGWAYWPNDLSFRKETSYGKYGYCVLE